MIQFIWILFQTMSDEVTEMIWKMPNVCLQKGSIVPVYGDSAPFCSSNWEKLDDSMMKTV